MDQPLLCICFHLLCIWLLASSRCCLALTPRRIIKDYISSPLLWGCFGLCMADPQSSVLGSLFPFASCFNRFLDLLLYPTIFNGSLISRVPRFLELVIHQVLIDITYLPFLSMGSTETWVSTWVSGVLVVFFHPLS